MFSPMPPCALLRRLATPRHELCSITKLSWQNRYQGNWQARSLFTKSKRKTKRRISLIARTTIIGATAVVFTGGLSYILYRNDHLQPLPPTRLRSEIRAERQKYEAVEEKKHKVATENAEHLSALPFQQDQEAVAASADSSAWGSFTTKFAVF
jgi:phospholipase A2